MCIVEARSIDDYDAAVTDEVIRNVEMGEDIMLEVCSVRLKIVPNWGDV